MTFLQETVGFYNISHFIISLYFEFHKYLSLFDFLKQRSCGRNIFHVLLIKSDYPLLKCTCSTLGSRRPSLLFLVFLIYGPIILPSYKIIEGKYMYVFIQIKFLIINPFYAITPQILYISSFCILFYRTSHCLLFTLI